MTASKPRQRADIASILALDVPVVVRLGRRVMSVRELVKLVPGAIVQLPKDAEDELELLINNKLIGSGRAVKIGENFGIRVTFVGDVRERVDAMAAKPRAKEDAVADEAAALAAQLLANQV